MFESHAFHEDCVCPFCTSMREIACATPFNPITEEQYAQIIDALHDTWVPGKEMVGEDA